MAQSGHPDPLNQCPLLGVKRTSDGGASMSAFDPKRTSADIDFCAVLGEDLWPLGHADRLVESYASGPTGPSNVGL